MFIDIPENRKDLWEKFDSRNFPTWSYRRGEGDDYYQGGGWPITREGRLKFGFRGRKVSDVDCNINHDAKTCRPSSRISKTILLLPTCESFVEDPDEGLTCALYSRISTPRTKYTSEPISTIPLYGLKLVKEVIGKAFPELAEFGFTDTRVRLRCLMTVSRQMHANSRTAMLVYRFDR